MEKESCKLNIISNDTGKTRPLTLLLALVKTQQLVPLAKTTTDGLGW